MTTYIYMCNPSSPNKGAATANNFQLLCEQILHALLADELPGLLQIILGLGHFSSFFVYHRLYI